MSRTRERIGKIALALLGIVITLVLVEGLARLLAPAPGTVQFVPDEQVGYRHAPNQNVWVSDETGEFAARFTTNAFGDPDRERSLAKPAGAFRIAVIGDSMVEAAQVPLEERFTSLLEEQLTAWVAARPGETGQVEVLNFGTAGYSTAQEWLLYRSHVRQFDPDLVVLVFLPGNDIKNNSYELEVVQSCRPEMAPFYRLTDDRELTLMNEQFYDLALNRYQNADQTWREKLKELVVEKIRLVGLANRAYAAVQSGSITSGRAAQLDQDACQTETTLQLYDPEVQQASADWREAWRITGSIIDRFAREVAADGAGFHLVTVTGPWEVLPETRDLVLSEAEQAHYDWALAQRMTAEMAAGLGIPHFQALPAMQRAPQQDGAAVHYRYNGHYTPAGHQILAQELLPILQAYLTE